MKVLFLDVDGVVNAVSQPLDSVPAEHTATAIANMRKRRQEAKHGN